jgi:hypothetical protein
VCDASAANPGAFRAAADRLRKRDPRLVDVDVITSLSIPCVRGMHVAGLTRSPGGARVDQRISGGGRGGQEEATGRREASCEAGLLTPADGGTSRDRTILGAAPFAGAV